jgi:hypothetical protein
MSAFDMKRTFGQNQEQVRVAKLRCFPLRLAYNSQNATRFIRAVFTRQESGSGRDHVLRRLHRHVCAISAVDRIEQGYDDVDVSAVVRIISHTATACANRFVAATCGPNPDIAC